MTTTKTILNELGPVSTTKQSTERWVCLNSFTPYLINQCLSADQYIWIVSEVLVIPESPEKNVCPTFHLNIVCYKCSWCKKLGLKPKVMGLLCAGVTGRFQSFLISLAICRLITPECYSPFWMHYLFWHYWFLKIKMHYIDPLNCDLFLHVVTSTDATNIII